MGHIGRDSLDAADRLRDGTAWDGDVLAHLEPISRGQCGVDVYPGLGK